MTSLLHIDNELTAWESNLPSNWHYRVVLCSPDEKFYGTSYYIYLSYWNATVWREYFTIRMILTSLENTLSLSIDSNNTEFRRHHHYTLHIHQKVCTDVCASAPYFLGRVNDAPVLNRSLGGYHFLWIVFVCACMPLISNSQRLWAIEQLEKIGHSLWIRLALLLTDIMRSRGSLIYRENSSAKSLQNLALYKYILSNLFTR